MVWLSVTVWAACSHMAPNRWAPCALRLCSWARTLLDWQSRFSPGLSPAPLHRRLLFAACVLARSTLAIAESDCAPDGLASARCSCTCVSQRPAELDVVHLCRRLQHCFQSSESCLGWRGCWSTPRLERRARCCAAAWLTFHPSKSTLQLLQYVAFAMSPIPHLRFHTRSPTILVSLAHGSRT